MSSYLSRTNAIGIAVVLLIAGTAHAQEAELVITIGKDIVESLGGDAAEFGGEAVAKQTAERLVVEATESAGREGGEVAKVQVERIIAMGKETLIFDLKRISGKSLPVLANISEQSLPAAVTTLARPGVEAGIESLGTIVLKRAALAGESRLPGAGLKVVEGFGEDGACIVDVLSEDQANNLVGGLHEQEINALEKAERSSLLNALASRPDAMIRNFKDLTGPLVVVAAGMVIWHGETLAISPDEKVTTQPNGTVTSEKTGFMSRAMSVIPRATHDLSESLKWIGIVSAIACSCVLGIYGWRRENRVRQPSTARPTRSFES